MKRSGAWFLGILVVLGIVGAVAIALRPVFQRETVAVVYLRNQRCWGPTGDAVLRGALAALKETSDRAGRYRIEYMDHMPSDHDVTDVVAAYLGTADTLVLRPSEPVPFAVSLFALNPVEPVHCLQIGPGFERQGKAAAAWAKKAGVQRVVLLIDLPHPRSEAIAEAFRSAGRALGLAVDEPIQALPDRIDQIVGSKPDLVFYAGEEAPYGTTSKIFSALREKGYAGKLATADADPEVSLLATRPELVEGSYLVSPFAPAPPEVAARVTAGTGPHVTAGYLAMKAVLETIDRADSVDPVELRRAASTMPSFDALRPCALYVAGKGRFEFVETLP